MYILHMMYFKSYCGNNILFLYDISFIVFCPPLIEPVFLLLHNILNFMQFFSVYSSQFLWLYDFYSKVRLSFVY